MNLLIRCERGAGWASVLGRLCIGITGVSFGRKPRKHCHVCSGGLRRVILICIWNIRSGLTLSCGGIFAKVVQAGDAMVGEVWPPLPGASHAVLMNTFPRTGLCSGQGGTQQCFMAFKKWCCSRITSLVFVVEYLAWSSFACASRFCVHSDFCSGAWNAVINLLFWFGPWFVS